MGESLAIPDYVSGLGQPVDPVKNLREAIAFKVGLAQKQADIAQSGAQTQYLQSEAATQAQKLSRAQQFQNDLTQVGSSPTAQNISSLMMKYPEFTDQLKSGWDVKDNAAKTADLTTLGETYSAAASGNWDIALKNAQSRVEADKASGNVDDGDQQMLDQISAAAGGDEKARKAVLTTLGTHIAAVSGPEHFATVYGALKGGYTLEPGAVRLDDNGNMVGHSPMVKGDDGALYDWNSVMGGGTAGGHPSSATGPAAVAPGAAAVASALASSGLPAPVVAGFMGNFHAEGGWNGAQGDGGSASGWGQWRGERAANFEKVIGKSPQDATPQENAQFVAWEMQHPDQAGMSVQQRDAILAAKTPAQAAALIDKFYERSDGTARQSRMAAATAFAGASDVQASDGAPSSGPRPLLPGKPKPAPEGYEWNADGSKLQPIPGGPKDTTASVSGPEIDDAATQYLLTGQMPAMGMGAAGIKQEILARRSAIMKKVGISAEQLPAFQAQYKADQNALTKNSELLSNLQSSENALKANGQQVWNTHRQLVQDGIVAGNPWVTRQRLKYYENFGSPDQKAHVKTYLDAVNAYSTEYSKFMTAANGMGGSAAPSDSARQSAGELNDPGLAATPLLAHLRQGLTEAVNKRNGVQQQNNLLQHKLSSYLHPHGDSAPKPTAGSKPPAGATKTATGPNGEKAALVNGHWVRY